MFRCSLRISLGLLDVHQEALKLWCVSVGVNRRGRKHINAVPPVFRTAIANSAISPVDGNADRINRLILPGEFQWLNALGDHGPGVIHAVFLTVLRAASSGGNLEPVSSLDGQLACELFRYFH